MPKYLLRAVKQVVVLELTGKEIEVEAETRSQLNVAGIKFLQEHFGGRPDIELEIKELKKKLDGMPEEPADPFGTGESPSAPGGNGGFGPRGKHPF